MTSKPPMLANRHNMQYILMVKIECLMLICDKHDSQLWSGDGIQEATCLDSLCSHGEINGIPYVTTPCQLRPIPRAHIHMSKYLILVKFKDWSFYIQVAYESQEIPEQHIVHYWRESATHRNWSTSISNLTSQSSYFEGILE